MQTWVDRLGGWVRRYGPAEVIGLAAAVVAGSAVAAHASTELPLIAYAASVAESIGFYAAFLVGQLVRSDGAGGRLRRIAVTASAMTVEFGPAEALDTLLLRPAAIAGATALSGNVVAGVVAGKLAADLVFYLVAATSYTVLARRLLARLAPPAAPPAAGEVAETASAGRPRDREAPSRLGRGRPAPPALVMDLDQVSEAYHRFVAAIPGVQVHFATKCNPDPGVLAHLHRLGSGFEIASHPELRLLRSLGVAPAEVIFSSPVKPWWHIEDAWVDGVRRFAVDSEGELAKLAAHAPGAEIYVRLATTGSSDVPSEGKFGVRPDAAVQLLRTAVDYGLRPWGIAFHVGSQMPDPEAWRAPINQAADALRTLRSDGIRLSALDIGGGFPADYGSRLPPIEAYGSVIADALRTLPYEVEVVAEPGRGLVADAGTLRTTVLGVAVRDGVRWAHLDVGAFNGGMEALETNYGLVLPMSDLRGGPTARWNVTGPSCDSQDTLRFAVPLSAALAPGDTVLLGTAGAYTTAYASEFNGFDVPRCVCVGGMRREPSATDTADEETRRSALLRR